MKYKQYCQWWQSGKPTLIDTTSFTILQSEDIDTLGSLGFSYEDHHIGENCRSDDVTFSAGSAGFQCTS